jgi:hypothetical protein
MHGAGEFMAGSGLSRFGLSKVMGVMFILVLVFGLCHLAHSSVLIFIVV